MLVERIINKVINEKIDIDKILVVTFTNAAASEMRERILDAIYKRLEDNPEDIHLQRQLNLLNKASICTIHSFCLDVIRNNFYEIDTSANFRIGDTAEIELLKNDVIEEVFEQKYLEQDKGFLKLIDTYTGYRGDEALVELVLKIYEYIQSSPFPEKWLEEKVELFNIEENIDLADTTWGKILLENINETIQECILKLEKARNITLKFSELEKYSNVLSNDIDNLKYINSDINSWDKTYNNVLNRNWEKWPVDRKVTIDIKNEVKEIRDKVKKQFSKIEMICNSKEAVQDIKVMHGILKELQILIKKFSINFAEKKKEKNIIDFHDIEHFALEILVTEKNGVIEKSEVAKKYAEKFVEIAIDEYQDSNLVQEHILNSIARGNNIFMVGDVKQSIYRFRQARPELFLEKYDTYNIKHDKDESGLKIKLFKNFRSRKNILRFTNLVFEDIMSKKLGDIEYNKEEYLNYKADYPIPEKNKNLKQAEDIEDLQENVNFGGITELNIINLKDEEDDIYKSEKVEKQETEVDSEAETEDQIENAVLEARFVANKIKEILNSNYYVFDKKEGYRKVTYKDICVLLRATSITAPIYEKEILEQNLPVFSDTSTTYLDTMEVQTILSLLKVIDNPMQDIPLVTILRSNIGQFDDNELINIRLVDKNSTFYEAMLKARLVVEKELKEKIENILNRLEKWKKDEQYLALDELIWKIYTETGFYHYVSLLSGGELRQANLKMLFEKAKQYEKASFKGLFNFIHFIDKVKISSGDLGSAKLIGENDNVIRIMSIHKSKGLEFPVVFLCGTGKKFNFQDLNDKILLHQDLGFGPKLIDSEKRIEYNTIAKEAIHIRSKIETISEEMRVLYVALTRAKEKLIITGMSKDLKKELAEKQQLLEIYSNIDNIARLNENGKEEYLPNKINYKLIEKYSSYLDWLELVYINNKDKEGDIFTLNEYSKSDILEMIKKENKEDINVEELLKAKLKNVNNNDNYKKEKLLKEQITKLLSWKYKYTESSKMPTKTSVTKLKQLSEPNNIVEQIYLEELFENEKMENQRALTYEPKFMEKVQKLSPAQKGTLMHLCVQKLNEQKDYEMKDIENFVNDLYEKEIISKIEKESVNLKALYKYTKSELWNELKNAKQIYKEQPFYINIPAKTIYKEADDKENILVQGIIDLYYIDKDDRLILVDYKTDYIKPGEEKALEEKYKVQLELYKQALEEALGRKVDKAIIYSLL